MRADCDGCFDETDMRLSQIDLNALMKNTSPRNSDIHASNAVYRGSAMSEDKLDAGKKDKDIQDVKPHSDCI
jgi:hypothetical protein